jgi:CheY-like chemotaxis protein
MSIAAAFAPHLPYLRRYGRALTGSQASGDAYVRAALEALLEGKEELAAEDPPKIALFRLFHAVWDPINGVDAKPRAAAKARRAGREALLLTAIEGFSPSETSRILSLPVADVEAAIAAARAGMLAERSRRIMIIEDEPIIALDLQHLVEGMKHACAGIATTHQEATALAVKERPDLILADIRLADGSSGLDAVKEILQTFSTPVIFITAFPERLLTGERPEPTYLISKPFLPETVRTTISQALFFHREENAAARNL